MSNASTLTAGVDTGKHTLDVAVHGQNTHFTAANDPAGWQGLASELARRGVGHVGIEATGGYERGVVRHLRANGLTVHVLQPMQVKAYARLHLKRAKNDRIDCALIAACTAALDAAPPAPDPRLDPLTEPLTFVEQLEEDIARAKTRLEHVSDKRLRRIALRNLARLAAQRDAELQRIALALRSHGAIARRLDLVLSVPGIGERTAIALVVRLPELGKVNRETAAALAGLAPFDADSGQHKGQRTIAGGRARLRKALYAAALPAAYFWNPALKAFYRRLRERGKSHKAALVACARKLLIYANTVVQRGTPWQAAADQAAPAAA